MNELSVIPPFEVDQHITAHSRYYAGQAGSRFYRALRDEKKILASPCAGCNLVYWPPRTTCGRCFAALKVEDMVAVGPQGSVETFTRVAYAEPVHPVPAPFCYVVVKLDGADTGMTHFLTGIDFAAVHVGLRVEAVFAEERRGDILDILFFRPLTGAAPAESL